MSSYQETMSAVREFLETSRAATPAIDVERTMQFLANFSASQLEALRTLRTERLLKESQDANLGLPEGVANAVVLKFLRKEKRAPATANAGDSPEFRGRRPSIEDYRGMSDNELVARFAQSPFNAEALPARALKRRVNGAPCVVYVEGEENVDLEATSTIVTARVRGVPVSRLFDKRVIYEVGARPNEMVFIDPLGSGELTVEGKDRTYGLKWIEVSEENRSFIMWLFSRGHLQKKALTRQVAAQLFTFAKHSLDSFASFYCDDVALLEFTLARSNGTAPQVQCLRSAIGASQDALTDGLQTAVRK